MSHGSRTSSEARTLRALGAVGLCIAIAAGAWLWWARDDRALPRTVAAAPAAAARDRAADPVDPVVVPVPRAASLERSIDRRAVVARVSPSETRTTPLGLDVEVGSPFVWRALSVELWPAGPDDGRELQRSPTVHPRSERRAALVFRDVPTGLWDVIFEHEPTGERCHRIEGVWVAPGAADDPRLDRVDLRAAVRTVGIRAVTERGGPVARGDVLLERADGRFRSQPLFEGQATLTLAKPAVAWVVARDHGVRRLGELFADRVVTLPSAPEVSLSFRLPNPLPDGVRADAHLVLRHLEAQLGAEALESAAVDERGIARLPVRAKLVHSVGLELYGNGTSAQLWAEPIALDPRALPAQVDVALDSGELSRAIARVAEGR